MDQTTIFLTIVGMGVVTYLPRLLPVWVLSQRTLPPLVVAWLRFVPVAVLAALLLPGLVMPEERLDLSFNNLYVWAAIPAIVVAWRTRSFFGTVLVGMGLVALLRWLNL
jgi:branched-subunit amino acid transport protein